MQNFKPPEQCVALATLGNSTGLEVVAFQQALKKSRTNAEGIPLATQLKECNCLSRGKRRRLPLSTKNGLTR